MRLLWRHGNVWLFRGGFCTLHNKTHHGGPWLSIENMLYSYFTQHSTGVFSFTFCAGSSLLKPAGAAAGRAGAGGGLGRDAARLAR